MQMNWSALCWYQNIDILIYLHVRGAVRFYPKGPASCIVEVWLLCSILNLNFSLLYLCCYRDSLHLFQSITDWQCLVHLIGAYVGHSIDATRQIIHFQFDYLINISLSLAINWTALSNSWPKKKKHPWATFILSIGVKENQWCHRLGFPLLGFFEE